jgi:hypothetical protein
MIDWGAADNGEDLLSKLVHFSRSTLPPRLQQDASVIIAMFAKIAAVAGMLSFCHQILVQASSGRSELSLRVELPDRRTVYLVIEYRDNRLAIRCEYVQQHPVITAGWLGHGHFDFWSKHMSATRTVPEFVTGRMLHAINRVLHNQPALSSRFAALASVPSGFGVQSLPHPRRLVQILQCANILEGTGIVTAQSPAALVAVAEDFCWVLAFSGLMDQPVVLGFSTDTDDWRLQLGQTVASGLDVKVGLWQHTVSDPSPQVHYCLGCGFNTSHPMHRAALTKPDQYMLVSWPGSTVVANRIGLRSYLTDQVYAFLRLNGPHQPPFFGAAAK